MQSTLLTCSGRVQARLPGTCRVARRGCAIRAQSSSQAEGHDLQKAATSLVMTTALLSTPAGLAFAEEAAPEATAAAAEAAEAGGIPVPEILLVLSPIILYGIFNLYRSQVDPRAKFSDFLFIVAAVAIVGNIISIVVFKRRFF